MNTQIENKASPPNILSYKNLIVFLEEYYSYRKLMNPSFSYEAWSYELKYSSRSFLKMICTKKRKVTIEFVDRFSKENQLTENEKKHFLILAQLNNNSTMDSKSIYTDILLETLDIDKKRFEIKNSSIFLENLKRPLIQMLISFCDFKATFSSISRVLKIDEVFIKSELEKIEDCGIVNQAESSDTGHLEQLRSSILGVRVQSEPSQCINDLSQFHSDTLREADLHLKLDNSDKKFKSIYFSAAEDDITDLKDDIELFIKKTKNKYATNFVKNKKIIKLNVNFYNVTEKVDD